MPSGIASIPRYQTGGPTRRDFLKRMLGGLGGLWASRFGKMDIDHPIATRSLPGPEDFAQGPHFEPHRRRFYPGSRLDQFRQEIAALQEELTLYGAPEPEDLIHDSWLWDELEYIGIDPEVLSQDAWEGLQSYPGQYDEASLWDEISEAQILTKRIKEEAEDQAKREAEKQARRQATRTVGRDVFDSRFSSPGILDSPSVRPSPSTAGRWGMSRGIGAFLGALGMGLGTAVDLAASPTKLGSGDLPESPRFTDEEMEIIRAKQREEFQLLENLGLTPRLPIGPRVSPQGASMRPRGYGRASGGIIGLRKVA